MAEQDRSYDLRTAFHSHYHQFVHTVEESMEHATDSTVLARLGDSIDEFVQLVNEVNSISIDFTDVALTIDISTRLSFTEMNWKSCAQALLPCKMTYACVTSKSSTAPIMGDPQW
jgi:hypothetical protein